MLVSLLWWRHKRITHDSLEHKRLMSLESNEARVRIKRLKLDITLKCDTYLGCNFQHMTHNPSSASKVAAVKVKTIKRQNQNTCPNRIPDLSPFFSGRQTQKRSDGARQAVICAVRPGPTFVSLKPHLDGINITGEVLRNEIFTLLLTCLSLW